VAAVGKDWRTAPVRPEVRAALGFIEKMVKGAVTTDDVRECYAAGVTKEALVRAAQVCVAFSMIVRLADTFEFDIPADFMPGAKSLWKRGYMM
jgi:alkylhydroperoxidase family enzyme